jgi:hypothetical protein
MKHLPLSTLTCGIPAKIAVTELIPSLTADGHYLQLSDLGPIIILLSLGTYIESGRAGRVLAKKARPRDCVATSLGSLKPLLDTWSQDEIPKGCSYLLG